MAMPAPKFTPEKPVEERVARIEAQTENLQSDMSEIKSEIRGIRVEMREMDNRLNGKVDDTGNRLGGKIDDTGNRLGGKIDAVKDSLAEFKLEMERRFASLERKISENMRWIIGVGLTVAISMLGGMAGGFFWLAERIAALQAQLPH